MDYAGSLDTLDVLEMIRLSDRELGIQAHVLEKENVRGEPENN
jgi:hypothetical protein